MDANLKAGLSNIIKNIKDAGALRGRNLSSDSNSQKHEIEIINTLLNTIKGSIEYKREVENCLGINFIPDLESLIRYWINGKDDEKFPNEFLTVYRSNLQYYGIIDSNLSSPLQYTPSRLNRENYLKNK